MSKPGTPKRVVTCGLSPEEAQQLEQAAETLQCSRPQVMKQAFQDYLARAAQQRRTTT